MINGFLFGLALILAPAMAWASDAMDWLNRAVQASHALNYAGVYVYQHGDHVEMLQVMQRVDPGGEKNKVEVIDGPHRVFLRLNDELYCHSADGKTVRLEKGAARRFFPSVLPASPAGLLEYYSPQMGGVERVASRECQVILLQPKDGFRFPHALCIDRASGLPLKSVTLNDMGAPVSSSTFAQLDIGKVPDSRLFVPRLAGKRVETGALDPAASPWQVTAPPGYVQVMESHRPLLGKSQPVTQMVFSDGLGALSVFIEPLPEVLHME